MLVKNPLLVIIQRKIPMLRSTLYVWIAEIAVWINQLLWSEICSAFVALIAVGSFVATMRTRSYYVFVGKELILLRVIVLFRSLLYELSFVIKLAEEVRCKLMMRIACGAGIYIKRDAKVLE